MALGDRKSSDIFNTRTGGSRDSKSIDETDKARIENSKEDLIFRAWLKLYIKVRNHLIDEGLDSLEL